ncbi:TetR family transcriptional regulator [Puteibacter caeruleilacunae]|nr:TetR family transcriptional regulator [Puteibacter caeruleilacunae]
MSKREEIIQKGAMIIHRKGYHNTGIKEILDEVKIPKGSFYFYFKSKQDFGLAVIEFFSKHVTSEFERITQSSLSPLDGLQRFFTEFLEFFHQSEYQGGCPLGNMALELADDEEIFRQALLDSFNSLTTRIQEKIASSNQSTDDNTGELAQFILFSWEGCIMQMKLQRSNEPIKTFNKIIFSNLLNSTL